jgi:hypothetical protein
MIPGIAASRLLILQRLAFRLRAGDIVEQEFKLLALTVDDLAISAHEHARENTAVRERGAMGSSPLHGVEPLRSRKSGVVWLPGGEKMPSAPLRLTNSG